VREECYAQALAGLIDAQHRQPLAAHWGSGATSSSDAQFFRAGGRGEVGGLVNLHYGQDPGVKFYTHLSDQFGPFHTKVIAATANEAPYVLDGLLYHQSSLVINEHYTDTGGFSDHVFAMCRLLELHAPRIRDLKDKRLYLLPGMTVPPEFAALVAGAINVRVISDQWFELLRLALSIKGNGHRFGDPRKLAAYPRQNSLALALRELGNWNGLSLRSNGCRIPTCVAVATTASPRGSNKMRSAAPSSSTGAAQSATAPMRTRATAPAV
jgi:TnpA family transposase